MSMLHEVFCFLEKLRASRSITASARLEEAVFDQLVYFGNILRHFWFSIEIAEIKRFELLI